MMKSGLILSKLEVLTLQMSDSVQLRRDDNLTQLHKEQEALMQALLAALLQERSWPEATEQRLWALLRQRESVETLLTEWLQSLQHERGGIVQQTRVLRHYSAS